MSITVGRFHFKDTVAELKDRDIECAATEVEHSDFLLLLRFVEAIGQGGGSRFVDDTAHFQAGDFACLLGGLTLRVIEVGRHCDYSLSDLLTEKLLSSLFHLLQNHGRDLLRGVVAAIDVDLREVVLAYHFIGHALDFISHLIAFLTHETLDRIDSTGRVSDGLTFSGVTHFALAAIDECHYRRSGVTAFVVGDHNRILTFKNSHARVGCTQVDTNNFSHDFYKF